MSLSICLLLVCFIVIGFCAYVFARRWHLRRLAENSERKFIAFAFPQTASGYATDRYELGGEFSSESSIVQTRLEQTFRNEIVTAAKEQQFVAELTPLLCEANTLLRRLHFFHIEPSEAICQFIDECNHLHLLIQRHNEAVYEERLAAEAHFFDTCLSYPLDRQQRRAIVSEEENCLVVSSAGSGKTSSIVGKVKYLTLRQGVKPEQILLISYTNKAAAELTERMGVAGLRGYTFHKFALDLIGKVTGQKPSICDNTDALFVKIVREMLAEPDFRKAVVTYFADYSEQEADWERRKNERRQELAEMKSVRLKCLLPDMDGNAVYVRSKQEQSICFALSSLGVKFRYEEPYEFPVADELHVQYKPDFSIHYEEHGQPRRIYLEHFGVDKHGLVPTWFAKDRGISYEEANERYGDGITWKKATHEKFGTTLLTTSSADFRFRDIRHKLKGELKRMGVPLHEYSEQELYEMVLPVGSKQEKAFIRLVATFIALLKSSGRDIGGILQSADDERSRFIIRNIFLPVFERYTATLAQSGQIDFTDAILQATKICADGHPVAFSHIIVDEFQDISFDRYALLKALRESPSPAKLFCVGDDWQSIYRFSGSDVALFSRFADFFGPTDVCKIETTYRFGEPLVGLSSLFIQRNEAQIEKHIHPFRPDAQTALQFVAYNRAEYCSTLAAIIDTIPPDKSVFLLGRYTFDDYYLSFQYKSTREGDKFYYLIGQRKVEFLTVHKSKGLEADYVILLLCNKDTYGFPSGINDDPVLHHVLTQSDLFPYGEERRLFYVAITRARHKTWVLYDQRFPSVFVDEFIRPQTITMESYEKHPNRGKRWTRAADRFLLQLHAEGKSVKEISRKMGRSQTSIIMRLGKLGIG